MDLPWNAGRAVGAALGASFLTWPALAQTPNEVSPVVVTATLIPTPIDQVGSSVTLIDSRDIAEHQWRDVPSALQQVPGLSVVQSGGPGGLTSVFIRGANSNHTKVLIDGIEVNDPSANDAFDFGQALAAGVSRIEVLRGPESSLYGSDALGGVVDIVTPEGNGPLRLDARLEGGSFAAFNQDFAVSGSVRGFRYALDLGHVHVGATPVTPLDLLAPGEARRDDSADNLTVSGKFGYRVSPALDLGLVVREVVTDLENTGENYNLYPAPNAPDAQQTEQRARHTYVRGEARLDLADGRFANVFGVGFSEDHTDIYSPNDGFGLPAPVQDYGDRLKVDWRGTIQLAKGETLVLGAEDRRERVFDAPGDYSDADAAGFAEIQSSPLANLNVAASLRYDSDDRFGSKLTWRIAPAYTVHATGTVLRASYGTGFKAPTLTQLFVSFPAFDFYANPNLKPETSEGFDAGFEQPFLGGKLRLGATGFHERIRNLIEDNADFTSYANIGRATTYGAETFVSVDPSRRVSLRVDYTYLVARDDIARQELLRRPKTRINGTAVWRPNDRLTLSATGLYVGARVDGNRDFSIPRLTAGPYAVFGVAGEYALNKRLALFGRVDNLLNRRYEDPTGFQRPGIGVFGGVKASFGGSE